MSKTQVEHPKFAMSMFVNTADLYEAKAKYYKDLALSPAHKEVKTMCAGGSMEDLYKEQSDYYQSIVIAAEKKEANYQRLLRAEQESKKKAVPDAKTSKLTSELKEHKESLSYLSG